MVKRQFKCLGLNFHVEVPETVEEFDKLAGRVGACLEAAINNELYRGTLAEARYQFTTGLELKTGQERKFSTKEVKNADGSTKTVFDKWLESEAVYTKKVAGDNIEQYQYLADLISEGELIDDPSGAKNEDGTVKRVPKPGATMEEDGKTALFPGLVFDPTKAERGEGKPKTLAKTYTNAAQKIIDAGGAERVAEALSTKLGITVEPTLDGLANAIKIDQTKKDLAGEYMG